MAAHAMRFVVALCFIQASQAQFDSIFNVTAAVESLTNVVEILKNHAESSLYSNYQNIKTQVTALESHLKSNLTTTIAGVSAQVKQLVQDAEDQGIGASECGFDASANLSAINVALPVRLAHCSLDYLDAFNNYVIGIEDDISASDQAIKDAVSESANCGFLDFLSCATKIFVNATDFEKKKAENVEFQLADSATAAINLVATITLCDEEKSTQAVLDAYHVIPYTKACIAAKKAEMTASSSTTSS